MLANQHTPVAFLHFAAQATKPVKYPHTDRRRCYPNTASQIAQMQGLKTLFALYNRFNNNRSP
jgi:hypothetical protein